MTDGAGLQAGAREAVLARQRGYVERLAAKREASRHAFLGLDIECPPGVPEPRFDTALLARAALEIGGSRVLDTFSGHGAIAVALAAGGAGAVVACDIDPHCVAAAAGNALRNGQVIRVAQGDVFPPDAGLYDLITANPPYTDHDDTAPGRSIVWDPGRRALRRLLAGAGAVLAPGGALLMSWPGYESLQRLADEASQAGLRLSVLSTALDAATLDFADIPGGLSYSIVKLHA